MKIKLSLSTLESRENPSGVGTDDNTNWIDDDFCYFDGTFYTPPTDTNPLTNNPVNGTQGPGPDLLSGTSDTNPTIPDGTVGGGPNYTAPDNAVLPDGK